MAITFSPDTRSGVDERLPIALLGYISGTSQQIVSSIAISPDLYREELNIISSLSGDEGGLLFLPKVSWSGLTERTSTLSRPDSTVSSRVGSHSLDTLLHEKLMESTKGFKEKNEMHFVLSSTDQCNALDTLQHHQHQTCVEDGILVKKKQARRRPAFFIGIPYESSMMNDPSGKEMLSRWKGSQSRAAELDSLNHDLLRQSL
ncbi:omega-hydroxypalmitate O-feruloyl transferase [Striga asiatica]|uniref:Omega-hydroxypalmitate O-feruloyl transferase n=1 Tax=Striga asiatica TaxID=4170 RepID=A0A5A7RDY4_STRAF|nr:omega-hydroxypalmitate O-feruloyl transferase [Striga asiatica]